MLAALLILPAAAHSFEVPAIAGAPVAASAPSPSRIEQIEALYDQTHSLRQRCYERMDSFSRGADAEQLDKLGKVRGLMTGALAERNVKIEKTRAGLRRKQEAGELDESAWRAASDALDQAAALGNLFVYGFALPTLLEQLEPGRGGEVLLSEEEYRGLDALYKERAGVPSDAY